MLDKGLPELPNPADCQIAATEYCRRHGYSEAVLTEAYIEALLVDEELAEPPAVYDTVSDRHGLLL